MRQTASATGHTAGAQLTTVSGADFDEAAMRRHGRYRPVPWVSELGLVRASRQILDRMGVRTLWFADGPDDVHKNALANAQLCHQSESRAAR